MAMESSILPPDYHTHTSLCKHAEGVPADYRDVAEAKGLPHLASTDHCPTDDEFGFDHRMALDQFDQYREWVAAAQNSTGTPLLFGVEADYYRGCEKFLAPFLESLPLDLVLGSVHFLDYWSTDRATRGLGGGAAPELIWGRYFELIGELADTGLYDIVAHIDLPKRFGNPLPQARLRELALPALDRIAAAGMCLEINTSGILHPQREFYPSLSLLTWACERGIGLTFGSDSHHPSRVGDGFEAAVELARAAGYAESAHFKQRKKSMVTLPKLSAVQRS